MDAKVVDDLVQNAGFDTRRHAPNPGHRLADPPAGTERTQRPQRQQNRRGLAPTAAAVVSAINRAADRMGRAISYLRDDDGVNTGPGGQEKRLAGRGMIRRRSKRSMHF